MLNSVYWYRRDKCDFKKQNKKKQVGIISLSISHQLKLYELKMALIDYYCISVKLYVPVQRIVKFLLRIAASNDFICHVMYPQKTLVF